MAAEAKAKGLDVRCCFFHARTAQEIRAEDGLYDLVIGNNVLAHVPDINSFVEGLSLVLGPKGTITMEFPHLLRLIQNNQFDTIYHEHFHYLSLGTVKRLFHRHSLKIYDVEELPTHGGSLRIYAAHEDCTSIQERDSVSALLNQERDFGLENIQTYTNFPRQMQAIQRDALQLFSGLKKQGKRIAAFGAAAKGNTFLNYCGIKHDVIDFVVDSNPHKQGFYLPGSLIPIVGVDALRRYQPDYLLILPWNLKEEIMELTDYAGEWGCQFITCIPKIQVFSAHTSNAVCQTISEGPKML